MAGTSTRERILDATATLLRLRGFAGTGMKHVVAEAGAPLGSVYHFFPGGKEQLAAETLERAGAYYHDLVVAVLDAEDDIVDGVRAVFDGAAGVLVESGYEDACPVATVALEVASSNETLRQAADRVFESWVRSLAGRFVDAGMGPEVARSTAISVIALLEGAFMLSRSARTTEAMAATGDAAVALVAAALGR